VNSSPLGVLAALAERNPYGAGELIGGAAIGAVLPAAGRVGAEVVETASRLASRNVVGSAVEIGDVAATRRSGFIFRGDDRGPEVIFDEGFRPRGVSTDLYDYAANNVASIYVPTSTSPNVARYFAELQEGGFVYTIRGQAHGLDVNEILGKNSPHRNEFEIAVPGGIPSSEIMGARLVNPEGNFIGPFIKNPSYIP
jgi:hypothetical protein